MTTAASDPQIAPRPPARRAADQGVASALEAVLSENTRRVYGAPVAALRRLVRRDEPPLHALGAVDGSPLPGSASR